MPEIPKDLTAELRPTDSAPPHGDPLSPKVPDPVAASREAIPGDSPKRQGDPLAPAAPDRATP